MPRNSSGRYRPYDRSHIFPEKSLFSFVIPDVLWVVFFRRGKFPRPVKYLSETVRLFHQTSLPDSRHSVACGLFVHAQQYWLGQAFRPSHLLCGSKHLHLAAQTGGCEDNDGIANKVRYALFSFHCSVPLIRFELVFIDLDLLTAFADAYQPGVLEPFQQALCGDSPCRALSALQCLPVSCQAGISNWTWKWNSLIRLRMYGTDFGSSP